MNICYNIKSRIQLFKQLFWDIEDFIDARAKNEARNAAMPKYKSVVDIPMFNGAKTLPEGTMGHFETCGEYKRPPSKRYAFFKDGFGITIPIDEIDNDSRFIKINS